MNYYDEYMKYKERYLDLQINIFGGAKRKIKKKKLKRKTKDNELLEAVKDNDTKMVKNLIKKGYDVNATFKDGNTLLHIAIKHGLPKIVDILIDNGAKINADNDFDDTPLHELAYATNLKKKKKRHIFDSLIEEDVKLNKRDDGGNTPLHIAVIEINPYIVRRLVEEGAKINLKNNNGNTPVEIARKALTLETGKDYNDLLNIINILEPQQIIYSQTSPISPAIPQISPRVPPGVPPRVPGVPSPEELLPKRCNLNFVEFLAHYFRYNYNQLIALLSYEGKPIRMGIKCGAGAVQNVPMEKWTVDWNTFAAEWGLVYEKKVYQGQTLYPGKCWAQPDIDVYLLYLLISIRGLLQQKGINICTQDRVSGIPPEKIIVDSSYDINIKDAGEYANTKIRRTMKEIVLMLDRARAGAILNGGIFLSTHLQKQFIYLTR